MCLTHHVKQVLGTSHFKKYMIEWQGIIKSIEFTEDDFVPNYVIWRAFQRGVEAERDRMYAITGEWPPRKANKEDKCHTQHQKT